MGEFLLDDLAAYFQCGGDLAVFNRQLDGKKLEPADPLEIRQVTPYPEFQVMDLAYRISNILMTLTELSDLSRQKYIPVGSGISESDFPSHTAWCIPAF